MRDALTFMLTLGLGMAIGAFAVALGVWWSLRPLAPTRDRNESGID